MSKIFGIDSHLGGTFSKWKFHVIPRTFNLSVTNFFISSASLQNFTNSLNLFFTARGMLQNTPSTNPCLLISLWQNYVNFLHKFQSLSF